MSKASDLESNLEYLISQTVAPKLLKFYLDSYSNEGYWSNGRFVGWKPKKRDDGNPILVKKGTMKQEFHITYTNDGFNIVNDAPYASYHNEGTGKIPARPFLYDDKKIDEVMSKEVEQSLKSIQGKFEKMLKAYLT